MLKALAFWFALWSSTTLATTVEDKATSRSRVDAATSTVHVFKLTNDAPPSTPATSWPRAKPDVLDIDLVNTDSLLKAKMLDGSPGYDGKGSALHYGSMSGDVDYRNGVADFNKKLSNPLCAPKWGTDASMGNLHYLESCTDGTLEPQPQNGCATCRLIFWEFNALAPAKEYYFRYMIWLDPITYTNDTELGIKQAGLGGDQLELGPKLATGGWELQTYRYGAESGAGYGVVEKMGFTILPGRWYTIEQHDKVNTVTDGVYNKDGVIEVKVDGKLIWSRQDVQQYASGVPQITSLLVQSYHGGLKKPAGILRERHARIAVCAKTWCGPAPEVGSNAVRR